MHDKHSHGLPIVTRVSVVVQQYWAIVLLYEIILMNANLVTSQQTLIIFQKHTFPIEVTYLLNVVIHFDIVYLFCFSNQ